MADTDTKTIEPGITPVPTETPMYAGGRVPDAIMDQRPKKKSKWDVEPRKQDLFLQEFIKNGGNATEAAWQTFNCKNRVVARQIGYQMLKKNNAIAGAFMEANRAGWGDLLLGAIEKNKESKTPEWFDRLMKIGGYEDFLSKGKEQTPVINIVQAQKDIMKDYVEGEIIDDEVD